MQLHFNISKLIFIVFAEKNVQFRINIMDNLLSGKRMSVDTDNSALLATWESNGEYVFHNTIVPVPPTASTLTPKTHSLQWGIALCDSITIFTDFGISGLCMLLDLNSYRACPP